jgi:hypothetical protein
VCTREWERAVGSSPPAACPYCGAMQLERGEPAERPRGGVVEAALREVEVYLDRFRAEMNGNLNRHADRVVEVAARSQPSRDYIAICAMNGLLAGSRETSGKHVVTQAYQMADLMLAERCGPKGEPAEAPRDTERPPAFTPEEAGTLEPVVVPTGRMVGADRADVEKLHQLVEALRALTPEQRFELVAMATGLNGKTSGKGEVLP